MKKTKLFLRGFRDGFKEFGKIITNIINTFLLLTIYFLGIGLAALITKITGQKLMSIEKKKTKSHYTIKKTEKQDVNECYKQY